MNSVRNREGVGLWVGVLIALIGLAGMVLPSILGVDMMGAGYGLACLGVFFLIMGLVVVVVYGLRARTMDRILAGKETLARWSYTEAEGRQQVESRYQRTAGTNRALYLIVLFWFVVIGGGIVVFDYARRGEINWTFAGLMLGILLLLGIVAWLAPRSQRRQAQRASREVIISRGGLVLNGALYSWGNFLSRLTGVSLDEGPDGPALEFSIRYPSRLGVLSYSTEAVRVPVPADHLEAARQVVVALQARA